MSGTVSLASHKMLNKSAHQVGGKTSSQAASSLPFGIDHILSSSSSPMKQAAAVQQAMASMEHQHDNQHTSHLTLGHYAQQHQQQQHQAAAMHLMLGSAAGIPTSSNGLGSLDAISLNEQLALLTGVSQQHHLLNPTALAAAAAAQQRLQWQQHQQQQQLMQAAAAAAAAAAASQHPGQGQLNPLSALSSLNSLASQTANSNSPATNHLLSCFMASLMIQQQQQQQQNQRKASALEHQQQQPHLMQQHPSFFSPPPPPLLSSQQQQTLNGNNCQQLGGSLAHLAASSSQLLASNRSPLPPLPASSTTPSSLGDFNQSANSSMKQLFGADSLAPKNSLFDLHQQRNTLSDPHRVSGAHQSPGQSASSERTSDSKPKAIDHKTRQQAAGLARGAANKTGGSSSSSATSNNNNNNNNSLVDDECAGSAALSSLSDFVSKSLAPILNESGHKSRTSHLFNSSTSVAGHQKSSTTKSLNSTPSSGSNSMIDDDHERGTKVTGAANSSSKNGDNLLNAVASALAKGQQQPDAVATINSTLAKAPPELIQKQPAWVFCTRYSDRPSSGPRTRRAKSKDKKPKDTKVSADEKRPRTAFTSEQLEKLRLEFQANTYLDEKRRKSLADRLCLNENQIKIWFQNKRAKMKKQSNQPNPLRGLLVAGGLYNHSTATSDCSESLANGHSDDVGNRRMRDFDQYNEDDAGAGDEVVNSDDHRTRNSDDGDGDDDENRLCDRHKSPRRTHTIENLSSADLLQDMQKQHRQIGSTGENGPLKRRLADDGDGFCGRTESPLTSAMKRPKFGNREQNGINDNNNSSSPLSSSHHEEDDLNDDEPVISVS